MGENARALHIEKRVRQVNAKVAVIPRENFQLAILYAHLAGARGVGSIAFNDLHTACLWLGIPYSDAQEGLTQARSAMVKEWGEEIIYSHVSSDQYQQADRPPSNIL